MVIPCVGIWIPDMSGIQMVEKRLFWKWSELWIGSEIWKSDHVKTDQDGIHILFTIWYLDFLVQILNGPGFLMVGILAIAKEWPFENQTFCNLPLKSLDFRSSL